MSGKRTTAHALFILLVLPLALSGQDLDSLRARDIETAGYYELRSWAEELDLSTAGSRRNLQDRLAAFYEVDIETSAPDEPQRTVRIEAADELQFFDTSEVEQEYVRLSGGVRIELVDRDDQARHVIEADEVVINQSNEVLSAYGSVLYEIERGEEVERFVGESLSVELDSWAGSFLYGTSTRPRVIEGDELEFRFEGSAITRSRDDIIVIDDGVITSSMATPPNYRITASRIWILEPGDWALQSAVLYVGRVPMFYFPYFFHPGRPNIFHPSFGFRDRDGAYVQTTYYVVGRRERDSQPLSVLQLAGADDDIDRVREGLFLRPATEEDPPLTDTADIVRMFADVYSNLGALLALDASWNDPPLTDSLDLFAGIAATRLQYSVPGGFDRRTTFFTDEEGQARQYWASSGFPGLEAPFRFAFDLSTGVTNGGLRLNLTIPLYSDPYFERDMLNRSEGADWGALIGLSDERDEPPGIRSTLTWRLGSSWSPSVSDLNPWVTQARLRSASTVLRFRRRTVPASRLEPYEIEAEGPPGESFFYPSSLTLPELSGQVAGTLFDSRGASTAGAESEPRDPGRIRAPNGNEAPSAERDESATGDASQAERESPRGAGGTMRTPAVRNAPPLAEEIDPWRNRLRYNASPSLTLEARTLDDEWEAPEDVDWELEYWEESRRVQASLTWDSSYLPPLLSLDTRLSVSDRYRNAFAFHESFDDAQRDTQRERSLRGNRTTLDSATGVGVAPLEDYDFFEGTRVNYNINLRVLDRQFEELRDSEPVYEVTPLAWDEEGVTAHNIGTTIAANTWNDRQTLGLRYDLPPREERGTGDLRLRTGPLESRLQSGYTRDRDTSEVEWDPLEVTEILRFTATSRFEQRLTYSIEEDQVDRTRSDLVLGPFNARLLAEQRDRFEFNEEELEWEAQDDVRLRASSASAGLDLSWEAEPFWRNRIRSSIDIDTSLSADLQQFTDSSLDVRFGLGLEVFQFLDLSISARSRNEQMYQYVPGLAEQVGRQTRNVLVDLGRSVNFFRREDREFSSFNLRELEIDAVHDLGDWDLTLRYRGGPTQVDRNGLQEIEWRGRVDISLDWRPIPEISRSFEIEDGVVDW